MTHLLQPFLNLFALRGSDAQGSCRLPVARPLRDWSLVVWGSIGLTLLLLMLAILFYFLSPWHVAQVPAAAQGTGLDAQKLESTLAHYETLSGEHAALLAASPSVVDPSR